MHKRGFTLIELIMVIVILGILAVIAVPRFIDLRSDASQAAIDGIEAAIESGAQLHHAKFLIDSTHPDFTAAYPAGWADCLDSNTTSDINKNYTISYDAVTGQVTAAEL